MIIHLKILHLVLILQAVIGQVRCDDTTETGTKDDLMESESKDPTKVEIIKQIKRVNDDGSYTFGYEAEDGTFKIESRDVLGNIKGTFGFVDADGEVKRVSYSSTNSTESATVSSTEKDRSSVIQQIPKGNRTVSSTTRRPGYSQATSSPSSTVIQSIPRRRISSSTTGNFSSTSNSTTDRPSYKNVVKSTDFDITRSSSTTEPSVRSTTQPRPTGHYIRSTIAPQNDPQRFTEGQLVRPTQPESVTPRPTENPYSRRLYITRNPFLEEPVSSTIKPIVEDTSYDDNMRSNLLRRQLSQEKVSSNFDARQHVLNLQQSVGDDSTDVYSASLTTGTPRPLFTTTDRPRVFPTTISNPKAITPAKYQPIYQRNLLRNPRPTQNYLQETTTDATNPENYVTPNPIPVLQIPEVEAQPVPVRTRHPFHRGAILIPVNQVQNGRYIIEDPAGVNQQYVQQIIIPADQQYVRDPNQINQIPDPRVAIPYQVVPRRRPVVQVEDYPRPVQVQQVQQVQEYPRQIQLDDYPNPPVQNLFTPRQYPVPLPANPIEFQNDIDSIKSPVSTRDFQKLLNRLIVRQSQLQEISRIENARMMQEAYVNPQRYNRVHPTPISVFVRTQPDSGQNNGPVQFVGHHQVQRSRNFINIPQGQPQQVPMQKLMESQQQYNTADPYNSDYVQEQSYQSGRRVARLLHQNSRSKQEQTNFLPADVREMLLLRMLQLAINPNLPIPPSEGDNMVTAIRQHKKSAVRNVEILGEESEEAKPVSRNKRYRESDEYEYY